MIFFFFFLIYFACLIFFVGPILFFLEILKSNKIPWTVISVKLAEPGRNFFWKKIKKNLFIFIRKIMFTSCEVERRKFKRVLRVHFLTHFTKNVCRFLTPKVKSGTDMINPINRKLWFSILAWKKFLSWVFENFVENRQTKFHILKFRVCKHTLNLNSWNVLCLFPTKFSKIQLKNVFYAKIENQSFRLMGWSYLCHF